MEPKFVRVWGAEDGKTWVEMTDGSRRLVGAEELEALRRAAEGRVPTVDDKAVKGPRRKP
jgi:hypothetical protein